MADTEICYNIRQKLKFDLKDDPAVPDLNNVLVEQPQKPLHFRYTLETKQSTYVLGNGRPTIEQMVRQLSENCATNDD
jgi:hypothetical protein